MNINKSEKAPLNIANSKTPADTVVSGTKNKAGQALSPAVDILEDANVAQEVLSEAQNALLKKLILQCLEEAEPCINDIEEDSHSRKYNWEKYFNIAETHFLLGDTDAVEVYIQKAVSAGINLSGDYLKIAKLYSKTWDVAKTREFIDKLNPSEYVCNIDFEGIVEDFLNRWLFEDTTKLINDLHLKKIFDEGDVRRFMKMFSISLSHSHLWKGNGDEARKVLAEIAQKIWKYIPDEDSLTTVYNRDNPLVEISQAQIDADDIESAIQTASFIGRTKEYVQACLRIAKYYAAQSDPEKAKIFLQKAFERASDSKRFKYRKFTYNDSDFVEYIQMIAITSSEIGFKDLAKEYLDVGFKRIRSWKDWSSTNGGDVHLAEMIWTEGQIGQTESAKKKVYFSDGNNGQLKCIGIAKWQISQNDMSGAIDSLNQARLCNLNFGDNVESFLKNKYVIAQMFEALGNTEKMKETFQAAFETVKQMPNFRFGESNDRIDRLQDLLRRKFELNDDSGINAALGLVYSITDKISIYTLLTEIFGQRHDADNLFSNAQKALQLIKFSKQSPSSRANDFTKLAKVSARFNQLPNLIKKERILPALKKAIDNFDETSKEFVQSLGVIMNESERKVLFDQYEVAFGHKIPDTIWDIIQNGEQVLFDRPIKTDGYIQDCLRYMEREMRLTKEWEDNTIEHDEEPTRIDYETLIQQAQFVHDRKYTIDDLRPEGKNSQELLDDSVIAAIELGSVRMFHHMIRLWADIHTKDKKWKDLIWHAKNNKCMVILQYLTSIETP